jgi:hypothetical protein
LSDDTRPIDANYILWHAFINNCISAGIELPSPSFLFDTEDFDFFRSKGLTIYDNWLVQVATGSSVCSLSTSSNESSVCQVPMNFSKKIILIWMFAKCLQVLLEMRI